MDYLESLRNKVKEYATEAINCDKLKEYENAYDLYIKASDQLQLLMKYDQNPYSNKIYQDTVAVYLSRAKKLKEIMNKNKDDKNEDEKDVNLHINDNNLNYNSNIEIKEEKHNNLKYEKPISSLQYDKNEIQNDIPISSDRIVIYNKKKQIEKTKKLKCN